MYLKGGKKREGGWGDHMYLKCFSQASFEGIWLGKVDGEATVDGSMDVLHGEEEAASSVSTVTCTSYTDAGVSDCVVKWLKHTCSFIPRLTHSEIVKKGRAWDHFSCHQNVAGLLPVIRNDWQQASNILHILQPTLCLTFSV